MLEKLVKAKKIWTLPVNDLIQLVNPLTPNDQIEKRKQMIEYLILASSPQKVRTVYDSSKPDRRYDERDRDDYFRLATYIRSEKAIDHLIHIYGLYNSVEYSTRRQNIWLLRHLFANHDVQTHSLFNSSTAKFEGKYKEIFEMIRDYFSTRPIKKKDLKNRIIKKADLNLSSRHRKCSRFR